MAEKPTKPYKGFPLFAHNNGQWAKKIKGKLQYFGAWADPDAALRRFVAHRDYGDRDRDEATTIYDLSQMFLRSKKLQVERGERTQQLWLDYKSVCERLCAHFGNDTAITALTPVRLEEFRESWPKTWAAKTTNNLITRLSAVFAYAYEYELIEKPLRYKIALARVSSKKLAIERATNSEKYFESAEIRELVSHAPNQVKAMILLGINAGFGGADCGRLTWRQLDLEKAWFASPRQKTGQWREAWLWPETVEAIESSGKHDDELVFLTKYGKPWFVDGSNRNSLQGEFARLSKKLALHKKGRGHYSLRHVFLTIADEVGDTVAMRIVLGQKDSSISHHYRERIGKDRIRTVCDHVRQWYLGNSEKS